MSRVTVPVVALSLAGCLYPPSAPPPQTVSSSAAARAQARDPDVTPELIEHGREVFVAHCNRCHGYARIDAFTTEEWPGIVHRMAGKAGLGPDDEAALVDFVVAVAMTSGAEA